MPALNHPEKRTQAELKRWMRHQVHLRRYPRIRNLLAKRLGQEKHLHQVRKLNVQRKPREKGGDVGEELLLVAAAAVAVVEKNTLPTEPDNRKPESKAVSTPSKASPVPKASPSPRTHSPVTVSPHAGHAALPRPKRMKRPSAATSSLKRPSGSHEEIAESKDDVWIQFHNMDKPLNLNNLSPSQEMMLERGVPFNYVPGPHEQEQPVHDEQADEPSEPMNSKPNHALKMQPKATVKCSLRKPASKSPKARGSEKVSHVGTRNLFWYLESF